MKKSLLIFGIMLLFMEVLVGASFASGDEYILQKDYLYQNQSGILIEDAYVQIAVGSGDFIQYQDDKEISVIPKPDDVIVDEYGNYNVCYNLHNVKANEKFKVTVKRRSVADSYEEYIPGRTNTDHFTGEEIYLKSQADYSHSGDRKYDMISVTDEDIVSKAKELTENYTSDYKKAQAIFDYVNVNLDYTDNADYANKGAVSAIKSMKGVCEEYATLFVSMCRVINIPSRCVGGFLVSGDTYDINHHLWAEIYLQDFGWVPVDPTLTYKDMPIDIPYGEAFCKHDNDSIKYVAECIYNPEVPDRIYTHQEYKGKVYGLTEVSVTQKLTPVEKVEEGRKNNFQDLQEYEWAKEAIDYLYSLSVINGYSDTEYGPERSISRIEFISMLARTLRYKETEADDKGLVYYYTDYDQSHWSKPDYDYLMRCYQNFNHYESDIASAGFSTIADIFIGRLDMDRPITRAEVVALMDVFLEDNYAATSLTDISNQRFRNSIIKAYNAKLIVGYPDNTFKPNNNITRAEIAVILERYIGGNTTLSII